MACTAESQSKNTQGHHKQTHSSTSHAQRLCHDMCSGGCTLLGSSNDQELRPRAVSWLHHAQKAPKQLDPLFVSQAPQKVFSIFFWIIGTPQKYLAIGCPSTVHAIAVFEFASAILTAPRRRLCESVGVGTAGKLHLPCPLFSHRR